MDLNKLSFKKVKNKYLRYIKSQEVLSEPFRDKIGQLDNFYLPIGKMIHKAYLKNKTTLKRMNHFLVEMVLLEFLLFK